AGLVLERYDEALSGDIRMNCDTCAYRVALPGFTDKVGRPQVPHYHPGDDQHRHAADTHATRADVPQHHAADIADRHAHAEGIHATHPDGTRHHTSDMDDHLGHRYEDAAHEVLS